MQRNRRRDKERREEEEERWNKRETTSEQGERTEIFQHVVISVWSTEHTLAESGRKSGSLMKHD